MQKDITLTLPQDVKTTELKWLSVWCRAFRVNFGDIFFPSNLVLEDEGSAEPEGGNDGLPPPLVPPSNNVHDPHHRHHDEDADAEGSYGEPEAEAASPESASNAVEASMVRIAMAAILCIVFGKW